MIKGNSIKEGHHIGHTAIQQHRGFMMQQGTIQPVIIILQVFMQQRTLVFIAGIIINGSTVANRGLLQLHRWIP